jgi:hypothetical protein
MATIPLGYKTRKKLRYYPAVDAAILLAECENVIPQCSSRQSAKIDAVKTLSFKSASRL